MNLNAKELGKLGGSKTSEAKARAARENGKKNSKASTERKKLMKIFQIQAKEHDRTGDVVLRERAADSWRHLATEAEASKAPRYIWWLGREK